MKTYQTYQTESRQAETKLRVAEQQRTKLEVTNAPPEKLARSKKYKLIEKELNKVPLAIQAAHFFLNERRLVPSHVSDVALINDALGPAIH